MKSILLLVSLVMATEAFGGLPPTTLKSQSGTKATTFNFQVPHNQATAVSGAKLIESGNKNRLKNPGFEAIASSAADWDIAVTGTATPGLTTESVAPIEGKQSLIFSCAGGASGGTCTLSQDVATAYALQGLASIFIESDSPTGVKFYNRVNAANSLSVNVDTITASIRKIPFVLGTTSSGLAVEITVAAAQTIEVLLDEAFVGAQDLKQDATAIVSQTTTFTAGSTGAGVTLAGTATTTGSGNYSFSAGTFTALRDIIINGSCVTQNSTTATTQPNWFLNGAGVGMFSNTAATTSLGVSASVNMRVAAGQTFYCNNQLSTASAGYVQVVATNIVNTSTYSSTNADTDWAACGHTTSDFTGFGTVTGIETQCKRQGGDLLMKGKFTSGTSTAVEARLNLKLNGLTLTSKNTSVIPSIQVAGNGARSVASEASYLTLIEPSVSHITFGIQNTGNAGLSKFNGSSFLVSGNLFSFNARIPINGWENSNQIIGSFAEIPTTRGSNGADIQSVYFGASADCSTNCTTGNCTICNRVGSKITSVSWNATGSYRVNGIDGTKYNCSGSAYNIGTGVVSVLHDRTASTSTYASALMFASATASNSGKAHVICIGIP